MQVRVVAIALAAVSLMGCGGNAGHAHPATPPAPPPTTSTTPSRSAKPPPPEPVLLQLELPMIGLSSAPLVHYSTTASRPAVKGVVKPAGATVYMLSPDGARIAVNPHVDGSFSVRAKVLPGENTFRFTAAKLGAASARASLSLNWTGAAARAMQQAIAADPAKYLPPASAGINRKIASLGNLPKIAGGAQAVSFHLDPIRAGAPPLGGGPGKWRSGFELTEYYPSLEAWFAGAPVAAPGLAARHRIDWLYSARGLSMEGDGIGLDGRQYHVQNLGAGGWLTAGGGNGARFGVGADAPYWRTGGFWRTRDGALTFPLKDGGWSNGAGAKYVPPPAGISFGAGPSRPLAYLRSVAVDPRVIPLGSHIYIPAYQAVNGGWFEADDTGGAIVGRHIDVFRPPPANPSDTGNFATGQRVYVIPPGTQLP